MAAKKLTVRICLPCGVGFQPIWSGRKYCSVRCGVEAKRKLPRETVCETCGKTIPVKRGRVRRFCSNDCWWKWERPKALDKKDCEGCGNVFHPRWAIQRFCSRACGYANRRVVRRTHCELCGQALSGQQPPRVRFCSHSCAAKARTDNTRFERATGEISPAGHGYLKIKVGRSRVGANKFGWMPHHRFVIEEHLNRTLEPHERVHHKNGDRADNRPENLELWKVKRKDPAGVRAADYHCAGCQCFVN
jgi:hypothetical protein